MPSIIQKSEASSFDLLKHKKRGIFKLNNGLLDTENLPYSFKTLAQSSLTYPSQSLNKVDVTKKSALKTIPEIKEKSAPITLINKKTLISLKKKKADFFFEMKLIALEKELSLKKEIIILRQELEEMQFAKEQSEYNDNSERKKYNCIKLT